MKKWARGLALLTAVAILALGGFAFAFPLFFSAPISVMRYESFTSLKSLVIWVYYFHSKVRELHWNPDTGLKDFSAASRQLRSRPNRDLLEVGKMDWHLGDFASAVANIEEYHRHNEETENSVFWLAMSYMRLGETRNCLDSLLDKSNNGHNAQPMCSLPLDAHHRQRVFSHKAADTFQKLLEDYDANDRVYRWLLNFCYMTIDAFPDGVPAKYRIDGKFVDTFYGERKDRMEREYAWLQLTDRAREFGIDTYNNGSGVAVEDFNGDGYLDIVTGGLFHPARYYRNEGGLGFTDLSQASGLSKIRGTHLMSAADYNNDGWMDVLISRTFGSPLGDFVLMRNNGDETFTDVTVATGLLPEPEARTERIVTWVSQWGDLDNDGDLDLFVGTWGFYNGVDSATYWLPFFGSMKSKLYRNDGERFVDISEEFGLDRAIRGRNVFGGAFGDYDGDGFMDLAVSLQWIPSVLLLRNDGGRRFVETDLIPSDAWGFMSAFLDINHDGLLDLYVGGSGSAYGITAQSVFSEDFDKFRNNTTVWVQDADGGWTSREDFFDRDMPMATMGSSFGDLNNDGAYDFYLGTGSPEGWLVLPNLLYMGRKEGGIGTGPMDNVSMLHGVGTIQKGHGIVFFDYDEDGDQDFYSSLGGMWPGDAWPNQFWVNESTVDGAWVKIRLRGRRSNRFGVGARIRVMTENENGDPATYYYYMTTKTTFGSAPYLAHMGLGDAKRILAAEVTWPGQTSARRYDAELGTTVLFDENGDSTILSIGKKKNSMEMEEALRRVPTSCAVCSTRFAQTRARTARRPKRGSSSV